MTDLIKKYGQPGTNQVMVTLPYRLRLSWQPTSTIGKMSCHKLVEDNVLAIFEETLKKYGSNEIQRLGLDMFGGCLSNPPRTMRGGTKPSLHNWGIAIDLDPQNNQLKWGRDKAHFARPEYDDFWAIVQKNGGYSLGRIKNYDWMHFQFEPVE